MTTHRPLILPLILPPKLTPESLHLINSIFALRFARRWTKPIHANELRQNASKSRAMQLPQKLRDPKKSARLVLGTSIVFVFAAISQMKALILRYYDSLLEPSTSCDLAIINQLANRHLGVGSDKKTPPQKASKTPGNAKTGGMTPLRCLALTRLRGDSYSPPLFQPRLRKACRLLAKDREEWRCLLASTARPAVLGAPRRRSE